MVAVAVAALEVVPLEEAVALTVAAAVAEEEVQAKLRVGSLFIKMLAPDAPNVVDTTYRLAASPHVTYVDSLWRHI